MAFLRIALRKNLFIDSLVEHFKKIMKMLNASIFSFTILNLVKKNIFDFHVTIATDICMKAYERSHSWLFSQSTLKENQGNIKSINFNYHCPKISQQRSFFTIPSYYRPLDIVQDSAILAICSSFHRQQRLSGGNLKNVADLTGKHLCRSLFFH